VAATPKGYVPISQAALETGYSYRYIRSLVAHGKVRAVETPNHPDRRVRQLVSLRSLKAHKHKTRPAS